MLRDAGIPETDMNGSCEVGEKLAALEALGFERRETGSFDGETVRLGRDTCETRSTVQAMGTRVVVVAQDGSPERTEEASGRALQEMERLVAILSRFDNRSAVTHLNDTGSLHNPPPELAHVIRRADRYHRITRGLFDITVAPLVDLFRMSGGVPPPRGDLAEAQALVGHEYLTVMKRVVRFDRSGMQITLDGIAKGYIVDGMAGVLRDHGIRDFLIDAGGEIRTSGLNHEGRAWRVAVRNPLGSGVVGDAIGLSEGAVATSGGYENFFDPNMQFHHIVDARVAASPARCASISVVAPTTMAADAMATGAFIMDPGSAIVLIDRLPGWACLVIDTNGNSLKSKRWNAELESP